MLLCLLLGSCCFFYPLLSRTYENEIHLLLCLFCSLLICLAYKNELGSLICMFCFLQVGSTYRNELGLLVLLQPLGRASSSHCLIIVDLPDAAPRDWVVDLLMGGRSDNINLANPWFAQYAIVMGDCIYDHECMWVDHRLGIDIEIYCPRGDWGCSIKARQWIALLILVFMPICWIIKRCRMLAALPSSMWIRSIISYEIWMLMTRASLCNRSSPIRSFF